MNKIIENQIIDFTDSLIAQVDGEDEIFLEAHFHCVPPEDQYQEARIATDLAPKVNKHIQPGSKVYIVGNDGPNLVHPDPKYPWIDTLKIWLTQGCDVSYLLLNPQPQVIEALKMNFSGFRGKFKVFTRDSQKNDSPGYKYLDQWETFHFAIFDNKKQMWIESNHPVGVPEAFDCAYFSPTNVEKTRLWDILKSRFEFVTASCCLPVSL